MSYTLGQAAKVVGMSKTSILRSIKAGRISAGRDEFGQWAIEPCELHRVYPALIEDTVTGNGTGERAVTGGGNGSCRSPCTRRPGRSTAIRLQVDARRHPRATGPLAAAGGTAGGTRDHGSAEGTRAGAASVMAPMAAYPDGRPRLFMACGPHVWGSSVGHLEGRQLAVRAALIMWRIMPPMDTRSKFNNLRRGSRSRLLPPLAMIFSC
jgi:hypothetical protein